MEEYITKEQAIDEVWDAFTIYDDEELGDDIEDKIKRLSPADVAPVVHGQWERMRRCSDAYGTTEATCQACKTQQRLGDYSDYCPKCGARMRKD